MNTPFFKRSLIFFFTIVLYSSCQQDLYQGKTSKQVVNDEKPIGRAEIKYAKGFNIDYYKNFKLLSIYTYEGNMADTAQYVLIKKNGAIPANFPDAQVIEIPVKSIIGMSSMHVALIDFAGAAESLKGLGNFKYVSSPAVRKLIAAGKIKEVGAEGNINNEQVLTMHPDLIMTVANVNAKVNRFKILTDAGIPVIHNSEFLESTPLGRTEWVKLIAVLTGKEELVNKKFDHIEAEYQRLSAIAAKATSKPRVITGMPVKGTWYVPDGDSYLTHFLQDAGASLKWANEHHIGSMPLSFEVVAPEALQAAYWFNQGYVNSKQDIAARDSRFADFGPFKNGNLFNFNKRVNAAGANDYWESGGVNPQIVLADLIKILHPELLPSHQLVYYRQLQ